MTRTDRDAAAWRAIRLAGRPLVPIGMTSPKAIVRLAHLRLREMRQAAALRRAENDNVGGGDAA